MPEGDDLDDLLSAARSARARRLDDVLGDLAGESVDAGTPDDAGAIEADASAIVTGDDYETRRARWVRGLSVVLAAVAFAGLLTDAVAASQLLSGAGPWAFAIVWPLGGLSLLAAAALQARFVDRFARVGVMVGLLVGYSLVFLLVLVLAGLDLPTSWPAAVAWLLADQMNFLVPLVVWALAGDVFTAGEALTLYPRISRWTHVGQFAGLAVATAAALVWSDSGRALMWLLSLAPVACVAAALVAPRLLRDASTGVGHGREEDTGEAWRGTLAFIRELPSFLWLLRLSFAVMLAGTIVEFAFFELSGDRIQSAGRLQALYAGATLAGFALCWLVQATAASSILRRFGVQKVLLALPLATLLAGAVMVVAGSERSVVLAVAALLVWRLPRWSIDTSARQSAMALLPDERRARSSFAIDLAPIASALVASVVPISLMLLTGQRWLLGGSAVVLASLALVFGTRVVRHWETTQLNYRLKRRKRLR